MKKVLVATDFSANAYKAAQYAAFLAAPRGWQLKICHVYHPFYSGFQSEQQNELDKEQAQKLATSRMATFVHHLQQDFPDVNMQGICLAGNVVNTIIREAAQTETILIAVGTQGVTGVKYPLFGSITYGVIRKATVPVLAVPGSIRQFSFRRVGFTTNFHAVEIAALYDFVDLVGDHIEVIPFHLYAVNKEAEEAKMTVWKTKTRKMISYRPLSFRLSRVRSYAAGIRRFIQREKLDALAMTRIEKGFFTRLTGRDLIKAVIHHCSVPVLFFPEV